MSKIKEIPSELFNPIFTCKRCGANIFSPTSLGTHKFGAASIGFVKMKVCSNCFNGSDIEF
jgi:transcription elongation factor Elf1